MTAAIKYRGRLITVRQQPEGFFWRYEDQRFISAGLEPYPTRRAAIQAARAEINAEDGITEGEVA